MLFPPPGKSSGRDPAETSPRLNMQLFWRLLQRSKLLSSRTPKPCLEYSYTMPTFSQIHRSSVPHLLCLPPNSPNSKKPYHADQCHASVQTVNYVQWSMHVVQTSQIMVHDRSHTMQRTQRNDNAPGRARKSMKNTSSPTEKTSPSSDHAGGHRHHPAHRATGEHGADRCSRIGEHHPRQQKWHMVRAHRS